jgi:NTE family protein
LTGEIAELKAAGVTVIHIEPQNAELAAKGPNFMDSTRRGATITAARRHLLEGVTAAATSAW